MFDLRTELKATYMYNLGYFTDRTTTLSMNDSIVMKGFVNARHVIDMTGDRYCELLSDRIKAGEKLRRVKAATDLGVQHPIHNKATLQIIISV